MRYLVLFYNSFWGRYPDCVIFPSVPEVEYTTKRSRLREADAVVFHLPQARDIQDAAKYPGQIWVGWSMESRAHTAILSDESVMAAFDMHMGFERSSDVWCPYIPLLEYFAAAQAEPVDGSEDTPAVLIQSANTDLWGRDRYIAELMQHLPVHSYGRYLNNRAIPQPDRGTESKLKIIRRYKFTLCFENTIEPDYVTEKFFQPLRAASIPVYHGAPNIDDFAPGENCFINAAHHSPRELAELLAATAANPEALARYHAWRRQPLRPEFVQLYERRGVDKYEELARTLKQRLDARGPRPRGWPTRPFGWRGYAETRWRKLKATAAKARKAISPR